MEGLGGLVNQGLNNPSFADHDTNMNSWVDNLITNNTHLNFIDRVARPELYPTIPSKEGIATHLMSWDTIDGKPAVFPTIIFDPESQQLKKLPIDAAYEHAIKTKEYLPFSSEEEADLFSQQYKRHWRNGKGPKGYYAPN